MLLELNIAIKNNFLKLVFSIDYSLGLPIDESYFHRDSAQVPRKYLL